MRKVFTFLIAGLFNAISANCQQEMKNWYFGTGTDGIQFVNNIPQKLSNKRPNVGFEGMIVVNDPVTGDLLFYSDGISVVDKNHNVMANGSGLTGHISGAQCVQSLPVPGSCAQKFYLFTNSAFDNTQGQISYSIIDFTSNPLGVVTNKNTLFWTGPSDQGMCLVNKPGTTDYWLIANQFNTARYNVWPITSSGIGSPVIYTFSNTGSSYQMNYDKTVKKISVTGFGNKKVTLINFDPLSGVLSNEIQLAAGFAESAAIRFSPDGTKLYAGLSNTAGGIPALYQYDFNTSAWVNMGACCFAHDLKMGPDNKMYHIHTYNNSQPMSVIDSPNLSAVGNACNYHTISFTPAFNGEVRRFPEFITLPERPSANTDVVTLTGSSISVPVMNNDAGNGIFLDAIVTPPLYGTAVIAGNNINYTLTQPVCSIIDTVVYRIRDNNCGTDTAMIIINIPGGMEFDFNFRQDACNPLSVQFFGMGNTPASFYWSFGDGDFTTTQASPVHVYPAAGTYLVKYRQPVTGSCDDTVRKIITIGAFPGDIIITPDTTICPGATKQLRTQPALGFCWSPVTSLNDPFSATPITNTSVPIRYFFNAEIQGNNLATNADFSSGNTGFGSELTYSVVNNGEGQYFVGNNPSAWNAAFNSCTDHTGSGGNMLIVNGNENANAKIWNQSVSITPNTNYVFAVWIQSLSPVNPASLVFNVNGRDLRPTVVSAPATTCNWQRFHATWNSGNNNSVSLAIISKNLTPLGNDYALDDILFANVAMKRDSVQINIDNPQVQTIIDSSVCKGIPVTLTTTGAQTYSWSPATGLDDPNVQNPVATPAINTEYIVTGTTIYGCMDKDTVNIFVKPAPLVQSIADTTICSSQNIILTTNGAQSYSWSPTTQLSDPTSPNPVFSGNTSQTYTVTGTAANGCSATDQVTVNVVIPSPFLAPSNRMTCSGEPVQLDGNNNPLFNYQWSPATYLSNPNIINPIANPPSTMVYTLTVNDNTCSRTQNFSVTVSTIAKVQVNITKSGDIDCVNRSVTLNASGGNQYLWSPATGLSDPTSPSPLAAPTGDQTYTVTVSNNGSCSNQASITVLDKRAFSLARYMPSAFTPNGDGLNDCYRLKNWQYVQKLQFFIYNRWGELVFYTSRPDRCWDGTYLGKNAEAGTYVYRIRAETKCGIEEQKGSFILIR